MTSNMFPGVEHPEIFLKLNTRRNLLDPSAGTKIIVAKFSNLYLSILLNNCSFEHSGTLGRPKGLLKDIGPECYKYLNIHIIEGRMFTCDENDDDKNHMLLRFYCQLKKG